MVFRKGHTPWNKGTKGIMKQNVTSFRKGFRHTQEFKDATSKRMKNNKYRVEVESWNKGMKGEYKLGACSEEKKLKISKANLGKKRSKETIRKLSLSHIGHKPWNYIDGRSKGQTWERYGVDWKRIRKQVLTRDNNQCQLCGKFEGRLEIHHITPFFISKDNSPENLITLCATCHRFVENRLLKGIKKISEMRRCKFG